MLKCFTVFKFISLQFICGHNNNIMCIVPDWVRKNWLQRASGPYFNKNETQRSLSLREMCSWQICARGKRVSQHWSANNPTLLLRLTHSMRHLLIHMSLDTELNVDAITAVHVTSEIEKEPLVHEERISNTILVFFIKPARSPFLLAFIYLILKEWNCQVWETARSLHAMQVQAMRSRSCICTYNWTWT